jgi:hypothetical protein
MHRTFVLSACAMTFAATVGLAVAAERPDPPAVPPRGTEGPDIRRNVEVQRPGCDGIRWECPADAQGVEGPDTR